MEDTAAAEAMLYPALPTIGVGAGIRVASCVVNRMLENPTHSPVEILSGAMAGLESAWFVLRLQELGLFPRRRCRAPRRAGIPARLSTGGRHGHARVLPGERETLHSAPGARRFSLRAVP